MRVNQTHLIKISPSSSLHDLGPRSQWTSGIRVTRCKIAESLASDDPHPLSLFTLCEHPEGKVKLLRSRIRRQIQHPLLPLLRELMRVQIIIRPPAADQVAVRAGFNNLPAFD